MIVIFFISSAAFIACFGQMLHITTTDEETIDAIVLCIFIAFVLAVYSAL